MKNNPNTALSFWITNISNMNISLYDLNLTVKAHTSINLLDCRHYHYTLEQLKLSSESGSIFKKRDKIFIRNVPPTVDNKNIEMVHSVFLPSKERSLYSIKQEKYEELTVSDTEYAEQNADLADLDQKPLKSLEQK